MKNSLKCPRQDSSEGSSLAVTASTCKAATNVNGATLHSVFLLPDVQIDAFVK